jgi:hypothetical protein
MEQRARSGDTADPVHGAATEVAHPDGHGEPAGDCDRPVIRSKVTVMAGEALSGGVVRRTRSGPASVETPPRAATRAVRRSNRRAGIMIGVDGLPNNARSGREPLPACQPEPAGQLP